MIFTVSEACDGMTVYKLLRSCGASRTLIKLLKSRPHGITVNGADVTVRAVVHTGDIFAAEDGDSFEDENKFVLPSDDPVDIIYEDEDVFVINKPSGMPTHTSHGHYADTLANALAAEYRRRGLPFVFRPVNRLDCDTSGAVLAAKSKLSACVMARAMEAGNIKKTYLAVLDGEMSLPCGEETSIRSYIRRRSDTIILRESLPLDYSGENIGDYAETVFRCIYKGGGHTVVEASPLTGRTHQLRVHFSSVGHPIAGDELYGGDHNVISRQALHARTLTFPTKNGTISITAEIPEDMRGLISDIRRSEDERKV